MIILPQKNLSAIGSALVKAGLSSEFAQGFDDTLSSEDLEGMLDDLLFDGEPDLLTDFLGSPLDTFDQRNVDDLISDLESHPLVQGGKIKREQDRILDENKKKLSKDQRRANMRRMDELSKDQQKNFEGFNPLLIYRTRQDGKVDDLICLPLEGEPFRKNDPRRPIIPEKTHPNCRCFWEDAITGENLGQF